MRKATKGAIHAVPCPHCGRKNDFRGLAGSDGTASGFGSYGLEPGTIAGCDNPQCRRRMKIISVATITVISVVQDNKG